MQYSIQWLTAKFDRGEPIKYIFFWGHSSKGHEDIGKFVFSQWYPSPFVVDDVEYKTAEHWMMAQKASLFGDGEILQKILQADSPAEAKKFGRMVRGFDDVIWNKKRFDIVRTGSIHKFHQNKKLRDFLTGTGEHVLVEASPADTIWGIGVSQDAPLVDNPYSWQGENLLGFGLMAARDFLIDVGDFRYATTAMLPPWKKFPTFDPWNIFWRMGDGEQHIIDLAKYLQSLPERDQLIYELTHPATGDWADFYSTER
jgi:ribA/ribD-fused uncharacterized protein